MPANQPVEELSYEQARDELVEVVRSLETGSASLEDSLRLWERGESLAARCQEYLDGARKRLDAVTGRTTQAADPVTPNP
ncbi:MAG TPA: exodeoxyribonuclease VII small subunit [Actinomycetaceae bacterium]|nr:exodeoxyribonuclease VII small subunit [Actinomycetaceae bacterium]